MDQNVFEIVKLLCELVFTLLTIYVIPIVKNYIQDRQIDSYCKKAVECAAQVLSDDPINNDAKKKIATDLVASLCQRVGIEINEAQISCLVESAYNVYKAGGK